MQLDCEPLERYALNDEQGLLAKLCYNRLIDIFLGMGCYSLQNHLRTTVQGMGQIETDEIYIGLDKRGVHYVIPVQAKGGKDQLGSVQLEQDIAMCKFPALMCIPVAAQFMANNLIALFSLNIPTKTFRFCAKNIIASWKPMNSRTRKYFATENEWIDCRLLFSPSKEPP